LDFGRLGVEKGSGELEFGGRQFVVFFMVRAMTFGYSAFGYRDLVAAVKWTTELSP
jgi:hypothetical protein